MVINKLIVRDEKVNKFKREYNNLHKCKSISRCMYIFLKPPSYALEGFDLMTHNTAGGDNTTTPCRHGDTNLHTLFRPGLPDFYLVQKYQNGKVYPMTTNNIKWP
jgi:hypothetical protein